MKKVIEGKVYNTETATKVAEYWNGLGRNDFNCIEEDLYVTKKGNWFIGYFGGANTGYSVSNGNYATGSEGIKALSNDEAYQWLQEHGKTEVIEKYFPDYIEEA